MCLHLTEKEKRFILKLRDKLKDMRCGKIELNVHDHNVSEDVKVTVKEKF